MYTFKQDGDRFVVSIDNHQELMGAIAAFCQEQGILAGRGERNRSGEQRDAEVPQPCHEALC